MFIPVNALEEFHEKVLQVFEKLIECPEAVFKNLKGAKVIFSIPSTGMI